MVNHTLSDALQTLAGIVACSLLFVAPGYAVAFAGNLLRFREHSLPLKLLWAVALSGPFSTVLAAVAGRVLPPAITVAVFVLLAVAAAILFLLHLRRARRQHFGPQFRLIGGVMALVAVYCVLATLGVQTRHALYENIYATDWNIRIPLVQSALRTGVPPHNPLFAVGGVSPAMRYYYFWYELCAQIVRLSHISPRAAFMASTVWSYFSLLAVILLLLRYLAPLRSEAPLCFPCGSSPPPASLRSIAVLAVGLTFVMGLDLLAAIAGLLFHRVRLMPEIESWRPDRMPSILSATLVAPHHVAGVAFGAAGFLLLALLPAGRRQRVLHALLAGVCFAALAGTSTYLAGCYALAVAFLFCLRLRGRQWGALACIALCAAVAFALAAPFLHDMASTSGLSAAAQLPQTQQAALGNHYLKLVLRNWHFSYGIVGFYAYQWGLPFLHNPLRYIFPLLLLPVLFLMELSIFAFVLWYQARADFATRRPLSDSAGILWCLFFAFALPGLLLNSEPTQGVNDLGRHTGLALRLVLIVWAAPMLANTWQRLRSGARLTPRGRWVVRLTLAGLAISLGGALWQATLARIYIPLVEHGIVNTRLLPAGSPFLEIRSASDIAASSLPADAILQSNPEGAWQAVFLLYTGRRMAAGDPGCESAFGGSFQTCRAQLIPPLHGLFGGSGLKRIADLEKLEPPADPAQMTPANFAAVCAHLHLSALLAARADPVWQVRDSWVWTEPALYAGDSVRVIPCPSR